MDKFTGRNKTLRRDLRAMMADGAAFSVMVGIGESYVPAFALALGLGDVAAGLIATVPMLAGGLMQLISPWAIERFGSHRNWIVVCACVQALTLVWMTDIALDVGLSPWIVFLPATLYWASGMATGPAWNAWVEKIVPTNQRTKVFGRRTRVSHLGVFVGLLAGGVILRSGETENAGTIFAVLFGIAAASRLFSAAMLATQSEPPAEDFSQPEESYRELFRSIRQHEGMKLILYLMAVQAAVNLAGPYFTPYMLLHLKLTYLEYVVLLSCGFLGKVIGLPWAVKFARQSGAGRLLWIGGVAIVPVAALWLVSNSIWYLIPLQLVSGVIWAAFELAMLLLFFEAIPRQQRVATLSLYNLGNAAAIVVGALVGAAVMRGFGEGRAPYLAVFFLSSVGRLAALLLIPKISVQPFEKVAPPLGLRTVAVRPMAGTIERPIISTVPAANGQVEHADAAHVS